MIQRSFKGVSWQFNDSFKDVLRMFQGWLTKVFSVFQENFKKHFKGVSVFQECFNKVLFCDFVVAWISLQLPEHKEGLLKLTLVRHIKVAIRNKK